MITAMVRGHLVNGVQPCLKHFPGHGDAEVDSHHELPIIDHDRRRFEAVEFVPFRRAMAEGVAAIMTAHLLIPAIDKERPASMSPTIVQGMLKDSLGFQGVVFSDDLGMKGVSATRPLPVASVDAIVAGTDAVLLCNSTAEEQVLAIEAIIRAAETNQITQKRIDDAMARQFQMKAHFLASGRPRATVPIGIVGSAAHQAVAKDMAAWL